MNIQGRYNASVWYWRIDQIPELAPLPPDEQDRLWRNARGRVKWTWETLAARVLPGAAMLGGLDLARDGFAGVRIQSIVQSPAKVFVYLAIFALWHFASFDTIARAAQPYIRMQLPGYCGCCGYNLTGNTSRTCPECGTKSESAKKPDM